jgi:activator of HSP90 ATPase
MRDAIRQEVVIDASQKTVYETFLDPESFSELGDGPAQIDPRPGGAFSWCGGMVSGRTIKLVPYERIVQAWRAAMWPEGVYSIVSVALQAEGSKTRLTLHHARPEKMPAQFKVRRGAQGR